MIPDRLFIPLGQFQLEVPYNWSVGFLSSLAEIKASNVDKKTHSDQQEVLLCNYMDVYANNEIDLSFDFMKATATPQEIKQFSLSIGDVLLTKDSETPDDIAIPSYVKETKDSLICGYHLYLIRPDQKKIDGKFLSFLVQTNEYRNYFLVNANGATRFGLGKSSLDNLQILLPPLPEQKKIASILSSVDDAIQATQKVIDQTEKVKQGLLQELLTKGIGHSEFKETEIGEIPVEWEVKSLEEIGDWKGGGTPSKREPKYWKNGTIPWVSPKDMKSAQIHTSSDYITEEAIIKSSTNKVKIDSILIVTRSGILQHTLPIALAKVELAINQDLKVIECDENVIHYKFPFYFLQLHEKQILFDCAKVGTTVESIDTTALKRYKIPLPPLDEQRKISEVVDAVDLQIMKENEKIVNLKLVKKGLMQDLLTGKVRVKV